MNDVKKQTGYLNITDAALRLIRKYYGKKNKRHYRKRKNIYIKHFFKVKMVLLLLKSLHVI